MRSVIFNKVKSLVNRKSFLLVLVALLIIGYASITTILTMNGSLALGEGGFVVKINRSVLNGANRPTFISKNGDTLTFETNDVTEVGESILDYEVVNMSSDYDAMTQITCSTDASNITINVSDNQKYVKAGESYSDTVKIDSVKREETGEVPESAVKLYDLVKNQSKGLETTVNLDYNQNNLENGVYETTNTDSGKSVYFYRGLVNNNIIYANKCWNIVRTTETDGVKLVYAGVPMNGSCDQTKILSGGTAYIPAQKWQVDNEQNDVAYVGYMSGKENADNYEDATANLNDSEMKKTIDAWYEANIKDTKYESMLEDTVFCNDRSLAKDLSNVDHHVKTIELVDCEEGDDESICIDGKKEVVRYPLFSEYYKDSLGYGDKSNIYSGFARIGVYSIQVQPTLKCAQSNDRFTVSEENGNGDLKYPIALLTADEVVYAGYAGSSYKNTEKIQPNLNIYLFRKNIFSSNMEISPSFSSLTMTPWASHLRSTSVANADDGNGKYYNAIALISSASRLAYKTVNHSDTGFSINPSLSLNNDNYVVSGDGTLDNPYILFAKGTASDKITCKLHVTAVERETRADEFDGIRSLYDSVAMSSLGTAEENNIDYNDISSDTNGKGVYLTDDTDSGKPVYFYRGDVEDNNVIFANHCWQIVRTTSSSGVKLIYNGEITENGTCNSTGENKAIGTSAFSTNVGDNAYVGYMYGDINATTYNDTHKPENDSDVKKMIDSWYEENILNTKYENMLEDIVFCNDRQIESDYSNYKYPGWLKVTNYTTDGFGTTKTLYQGTGRVGIVVGETKPTLQCPQLNDRFTVSDKIGNGALKYPIGLMTADETVFAGATGGFQNKNSNAYNTSYYLYVGGKHSWTLTPHRSDTTNIMLVAGSEGNIGNEVNKIDNVLVRPVISIKNDVMIVDGNGTKLSPYILKEKREVDASKIPADWNDQGIFKDYYVDAYNMLKKLTIGEKIGQLIMAHHNQSTAIEGVIKYNIGGYTYFEADFLGKSEAQVKKMIADEQAASKIPLITAVDEEGGRVVRIASNTTLISEEMKKYPNLFYTNVNNKNAWKLSRDLYASGGYDLIKTETEVKNGVLNRLGLNVNFAPVVDMAIEGAYISDRVIGLDANGTAEYGKTVINTSKGSNISYTLKHFPGYGNNSDTHSSGTVDNKTLEELLENDIVPFKESIEAGAEAVMISHNTVVAIDAENPASLSKNMNELLTDYLGFTGIVITDALDMGATKDIEKKFLKAIKAGNNLILVQKYADAYEELMSAYENEELSEEEIDKLVFKVLAWKYYKGLM